jgi:hypothetical protein
MKNLFTTEVLNTKKYYKDSYCNLYKTRIAFVNFAGNEQNFSAKKTKKKIHKSKLYLQEKIAMRWWFFVWQLVTLSAPEASAHIQDGTLALEKCHSKGLALRWNLRKPVLGIRIRRIRIFLGLLDPHPDPSIIKQKGSVCVWASRIGIRVR